MQYIAYPIPSEPEDLIADVIAFIQLRFPGWEPNDANLDTALIEALSATASDIRELASQVPDTVFRYFGANIVGLPPNDATAAVVASTWTARDAGGHTVPAGARVLLRDSSGTPQVFQVLLDVLIPPGSSATAAGAVSLVAVRAGAAGSGLGAPLGAMELVDVLDWVLTVNQVSVTSGGEDAELDTVYLGRLREYLTLLAPRPILPGDFALLSRQVAGVYRAVALDGYNPVHNLLSANDSSLETSVAGYAGTNCALAQSAAQAADAANSMRLTAASAADMYASLIAADSPAVTPGDTITAIAFFRSAVTARNTKVGIAWLDVANAIISTVFGANVGDTNAGFTEAFCTAVAPAGAVKASIVAFVIAPANAEVHYVDKLSIRRGASTDWVVGGTAETGNPRMVSVVAIDSAGAAVSTPVKSAIDAYLQARRETGFLVYEIDPTFTQIDVTYQVKSMPGYDPTDLLARINAALAGFLNAATWGVPPSGSITDWVNDPIARYLEIAQVINNVDGVDFITTTGGNYDLTIGVHGGALARIDVPLGGVAPLATAGTMTGTIT